MVVLKQEFPDATHHCFAWTLGIGAINFRAFDDGEPANSAGNPILRQIRSSELTNVLVVVIRYFGGKKLGIPGLIASYSAAAKLALEQCLFVEKQLKQIFSIKSKSEEYHQIYELARRLSVDLLMEETDEKITFNIAIDNNMLDRFIHLCSKYPNLVVAYKYTE